MNEKYEIRGTAVSPPTGPLANVSVRGFDADPGIDDPLDSTDTDSDGEFELAFGADAIGGSLEGDPEVYVRVFDADDRELHTEPIVLSGATTRADIVVPADSTENGETRLALPSGQAVARAMDEDALSNEEIGFDAALDAYGQPGRTEAPLWYYVLGEARETTGGERLGPVGSRIVAEVLVGLAAADPSSFLMVEPGWEPTLPAPCSADGEFAMGDLLAFALDY
ncbi:hypothetical protein BRC77_05105 [Halobacteriales archaeon QH_8_64_26]|nr:MAG: hypothetical protein BRC77_05105 [Halobacteriales archaeon QH_8_64_26]